MKKILKFLLIVFIWLIVLGICVTTAILLDYPIKSGAWVFAGIIGTWYTIKLVVFLVKRWQAKRRVEKLINMEAPESQKKKVSLIQFFAPKDIDKHLKNVIQRVTGSDMNVSYTGIDSYKWALHLKLDNTHNSWLKSASVNRPQLRDPIFNEYNHIDWYVYQQFMMLDVDAYLMQPENPSARNEWLQLLNGLSYSKKRKSLDSLVVSVHIDEMSNTESQQNIADKIRACYEDIKEFCGVDVAISIVIVGLEELNGVDSWLHGLDSFTKSKTLGCIKENSETPSQIATRFFDNLGEVFTQGALTYLVEEGFNSNAANLPTKSAKLQQSLTNCLTRIFSANKFQKAPELSGLFLVMKENSKYAFVDSLLEGEGLVWKAAASTLKKTVSDREKEKKQFTYLLASGVLSLLILFVYQYNFSRVENVFESYHKSLSNSESQSKLIDNLESRYRLVGNLEGLNIAHWLTANTNPLQIDKIRSQLISDINDLVIRPIDQSFESKLRTEEVTDLDARIDYLNVLTRRIAILKAAINGSGMSSLSEFPQPFDSSYIENTPAELLEATNNLYLKSLDLGQRSDADVFHRIWQKKIDKTKLQIETILESSNGNMTWIIDWVNQNKGIQDVLLSDYWQGSAELSDEVKVQRAYTVAGKTAVDSLIEHLQNAMGNENTYLNKYLGKFEKQYQTNYLASWGVFLKSFEQGSAMLANRNEWLNIINDLTTGRNIYFQLLNDVDYQLTAFKEIDEMPDWFVLTSYYQDMLALGEDEVQSNKKKNKVLSKLALKLIGATGPVGKAIATSGKSTLKTKKKLDKAAGKGPGPTERELNLQAAAKELDAYKQGISNLVFIAEQQTESYNNIKGMFANADNPTSAGTLLAASQTSIKKLQRLVSNSSTSTRPFWNIYEGPIRLLENFMMQETSCKVNQLWNDEFLFELDGVPDYKLDSFAYGEAGILWGFVNDRISPFLKKRKGGGYGFQKADKHRLDLTTNILNFLTRANDIGKSQKYDEFSLTIKAKPSGLNPDSLLYISKTELSMECSAGAQTIVNNNFINQTDFKWDPSCGPVSIRFYIGDKTVEKLYPGRNGVRDFLSDFNAGERTFELKDFPHDYYLLEQYKVSKIKSSFEIGGGRRLHSALSKQPPSPPNKIAKCWD